MYLSLRENRPIQDPFNYLAQSAPDTSGAGELYVFIPPEISPTGQGMHVREDLLDDLTPEEYNMVMEYVEPVNPALGVLPGIIGGAARAIGGLFRRRQPTAAAQAQATTSGVPAAQRPSIVGGAVRAIFGTPETRAAGRERRQERREARQTSKPGTSTTQGYQGGRVTPGSALITAITGGAGAGTTPGGEPPTPDTEKKWYENPWVWAGIGGGVLLIGGAVYFAKKRKH